MTMKIELTDDDKAQMSPEEIEALSGDVEAILGGRKPEATDDADPLGAKAEEKAEAAEAKAEDEKPEAKAEGEKAEEGAEEAPAVEAEPRDKPVRYDTGDVEQLKADRAAALEERKTLRAERRDIEAKWAAGDLSDDERAAKLDELDDKREALSDKAAELLGAITRAETLDAANRQHVLDTQTRVIQQIKAKGKAEGLDYDKTEGAPAQFDACLKALASTSPDKDFADLADEAHRMVKVMRGINEKPKAEPKPEAKPEAKAEPKAREVPRTLTGLPTAGTAPIGDDLAEQLASLDGEEAELFLAKLSADKVQRLLRRAH